MENMWLNLLMTELQYKWVLEQYLMLFLNVWKITKTSGIHTEMLSDGVINLIKDDIVNNKYKGFHDNVSITSFCFGTKNLYDFVDDNPSIAFLDVQHVNFPINIMKNHKMHAINSAIEIDLYRTSLCRFYWYLPIQRYRRTNGFYERCCP